MKIDAPDVFLVSNFRSLLKILATHSNHDFGSCISGVFSRINSDLEVVLVDLLKKRHFGFILSLAFLHFFIKVEEVVEIE